MRLKDNSYVLAQLLKSPYIVFFREFQQGGEWPVHAAEQAEPLFFCAVTKQFMKVSSLERKSKVRPKKFEHTPDRWIKRFPGSREVTVWKGDPNEASFILLSDRPGGSLIELHMEASGAASWPVIMSEIDLGDAATIDSHELNVIWLYPMLNERFLLCKKLGINADPEKDLTFNRPIRKEYATYIDMLAPRGTRSDWGYAEAPSGDDER